MLDVAERSVVPSLSRLPIMYNRPPNRSIPCLALVQVWHRRCQKRPCQAIAVADAVVRLEASEEQQQQVILVSMFYMRAHSPSSGCRQ